MALNKITYDNKVALNPQPSVANANKCTDSDLNEIKSVVNSAIDFCNEVIETGTTNGWTWVKYSNGIAECWKNKTWAVSVTNAWGTGLYYGTITGETLPTNLFIATPVLSFQNITGTSVICMNSSDASLTSTGDIQVARGTSSSGAGGTISIIAKGNWK